MPVASASPARDITFRLRPSWPMKKKVVMMEIGKDRLITNVLQPSRRKKKMIRTEKIPPSRASFLTSESALSMNSEASSMVLSSRPSIV